MNKISFCEDWKFWKIEAEKAGQEDSPVPVCLPHDAMQCEERRADAASGSGGAYFMGGSYVYEKTFLAPDAWTEQVVMVEFEGVYPSAKVFLNGTEIGGCAYGYNLFRVELTGLIYGADNRLRVEVDNSLLPNSRWYSGAGIYRPVWLLTMNREHILPDGVRVTTLSDAPAQIRIDVAVNVADCRKEEIVAEIYDQDKKVAEGTGVSQILRIPDAKLWDAGHPNLYRCVVTLYRDGEKVDVQETSFGIRSLKWSTDGFFVNGKRVLLKGGCIHHDNGILGARSYDKSEWRRVAKLKQMGFNAIRSSHNPACRAMLEACDALGMYVMDELWDMWDKSKTEFDYAGRFIENYETDVEKIAAKDYNHPSVILYSIGNEVTEPAKPEGVALAKRICDKVHAVDATRPVTAGINITLLYLATMENNPLEQATNSQSESATQATPSPQGDSEWRGSPNDGGGDAAPDTQEMNSTAYNEMVSMMGERMTMAAAMPPADEVSTPVLDLLDIAGYNYAVSRYEKEGEIHPNRIVVGSETYPYELAKTWPLVEKYPYLIGDFMWTAWDYLGETGIGGWSYDAEDMGFGKKYPWLLADTGAMDILGNDNAEAGLASVVWGARETPYIGVCPVNHPGVVANRAMWRGSNALPYWSYLGCDGNDADVEVYSRGAEVELFINEKSVGRECVKDMRADFHVTYEPGEIRAVAYLEDGSVLSESSLRSADTNTRIWIRPEEESVRKGDILYLDIAIGGENGIVECNCDTLLHVSVEGGELLAFGSANPKTEEKFLSREYTTYYGRAQAVVRALSDEVKVTVTGDGLADAQAAVPVKS
ncbi:MAG: DUF4982 domain-containing protein [Lachnospiraceae bacterium]|nr:DUF4982 domain-containing protein [Lachnospiraceae bacterium]